MTRMKIGALVMALLAAGLLAGCAGTGSSLPSESQILQDLQTSNIDFRKAGLELTYSLVTPGERDEEFGSAAYTVSYTAENAEADYVGEMELVYWLENDQWVLGDAVRTMDDYAVKQECSPELPEDYLRQYYSQYQTELTMLSQESLPDNENTFVFEVRGQENLVCSWTDRWTIQCSYDLYNGWEITEQEGQKTEEVWDLCGEYTLENDSISAYVNLSEFTMDVEQNRFTAVVSYSLTSHLGHRDLYSGPVMEQGVTYSSNSPERISGSIGYDHEYVKVDIGDFVTLTICGRYVSWDPIGEGLGIWIKINGRYTNDYGIFWLDRA